MDGVNKPVVLEAGQRWHHKDGSPWPPNKPAVVIREVAPGWVRYSVNEYLDDERMTEQKFREFFNEQVIS